MATATTDQEAKVGKPKYHPRYAVVVLNDDEHTYHYVIETLMKVFHYEQEQCFKLAQEIDHHGRAIVWTGSKEVAEFKRDQIKGAGPDLFATKPVTWPLGVELEPVDG